MISFEDFEQESGTPIYIQLLRYVKRGIVAGTIKNGDALPSRRVLSALFGVNPNTVQKAYRILEEEGLVQSHIGAKSYVVLNQASIEKLCAELLEEDARRIVGAMKQMGISKEKALALIEVYWE